VTDLDRSELNDRIHTCVEVLEKDIKRFVAHMPWEDGQPIRITFVYVPDERLLEFTAIWKEPVSYYA